MFDSFTWEIRAGIGILCLAKPPRNTLDHHFFAEFKIFTETLLNTAKLRGLVIQGSGKHFSTGADTAELGRLLGGAGSQPDFLLANSRAFASLETAAFPVVAAIAGCCLGAGLELALACRYRIGSPGSILAFPETSFGLIPGCGGTVRSTKILALGKAIDLILSARNILAEEAHALGLLNGLVPRGQLLPACLALIERLAVDSASR